ncbi:MFS transporter [Aliivibrio salmonicida]|uniref:MFS transporter n=1 Tax=Aliivibrio salmonicida TaxID=40269 RepID=UPI00406CCB85
MNLFEKIGFTSRNQLFGFFSVVMSGQIIYSAFEAFKGTFYNLLLEVLQIDNTQMGILFTLIGSAMFFYIPAGWVNNRFSVKSILMTSLTIRFLSMMGIIFLEPGFSVLVVIAGLWGLVDAAFWPSVVNGVTLMSGDKNKGMAFGLLESVRRAAEMSMNAVIVGIMALVGGSILVFQGAIVFYTLLILPMIFCVWKFVPDNHLEVKQGESKNKEALKGLVHVLKMPTVWLAAITSLTVYWIYITLIYTVPYLQAVFGLSTAQAAIFGIINTGAMGVIAGLVAGSIADFVFKSSIKMMFFALALTAICLGVTIALPKTERYVNDEHGVIDVLLIQHIFSKRHHLSASSRSWCAKGLQWFSNECWFVCRLCVSVLGLCTKWLDYRYLPSNSSVSNDLWYWLNRLRPWYGVFTYSNITEEEKQR